MLYSEVRSIIDFYFTPRWMLLLRESRLTPFVTHSSIVVNSNFWLSYRGECQFHITPGTKITKKRAITDLDCILTEPSEPNHTSRGQKR